MVKMRSKIIEKCKNIQLVITDVDGVLTDGGMYYSDKGETMKKFNTRDGMGVELLLGVGITTVFLTREKSKSTQQRAIKVKANLIQGISDKEKELGKICKMYGVDPQNIGYMGDDINDVAIMNKIGFSAAPSDCSPEVRKISDYVCKNKGGEGAFREFANLIVSSKGNSI
jgi:YrbI family 3-deoxy-D-manno-octulosonate 8-phosphate phosphatase